VGLWDWIWNTITGKYGTGADGPVAPTTEKVAETTVAVLEETPTREFPEEIAASAWWSPEGVTRTELYAPERPELSLQARAFENVLISNFDGHNLTMPPMPRIMERVLTLLRESSCDFDKVAEIISEDQVHAAAVLRLANSPLYRGMQEITAIKPAITRLGARALRTLMMHMAMKRATFSSRGGFREISELIWRRSLAAACIMRGLSRFTAIDPEDAFLIGLLHDIGNVIVLRLAQQETVAHHYEIDLDEFEYFCHEAHQEFGELVAGEWKLPERLRLLIADHHEYPAEGDPLRHDRLLLQLTDMINSMIGYGPPVSYDLLRTPHVQSLKLDERQDFHDFLAGLPDELDETMAAL